MSGTRNDISSAEDIRELVDRFYQALVIDEVVGHFFTGLDLEHHLPRISAFWEMVLLDKPGYNTNVTDVHLKLNERIPMERAHFDRWLALFRLAVDERYAGPRAEEAKLRALSIATVMLVKVQHP